MGYADRTTLNNLTPNMDIGDVADPALRLAAFQYLYNLSDQNYAYLQSLVTSGTLSPLPPEFKDRQGITNGDFQIASRGTTFTSIEYTLDRWYYSNNGSGQVHSVTQQAFALGQTDVPGEPKNFLRLNVTTAAAGQTYNVLEQKIESVRTYAGNNCAAPFYAKSDAARTITVNLWQNFGTGGSPSTAVLVGSTTVNLTTSWQLIGVTFTVPSIAGKTLGSNNDDNLMLEFALPLNTSFTFDLAQVGMNAGDSVLPFQQKRIDEEEIACLRFNHRLKGYGAYCVFGTGQAVSTTEARIFIPLSPRMRTLPTVTAGSIGLLTSAGSVIAATLSVSGGTEAMDGMLLVASVAGGLTAGDAVVLLANGSAAAYINFDAEI